MTQGTQASPRRAPGALILALSVAAGSSAHAQEELWVAGWLSNDIARYDAVTGAFLGHVIAPGGVARPHSLRVGPDCSLYVTSVGSNSVLRVDVDGGGSPATFAATGLSSPTSTTWDDSGDLYVTSFGNGRVVKFDGLTGAFDSAPITGPTGMEMVTFRPDGLLYLLHGGNADVRRYQTDGTFVDVFVDPGAGGLNDPHAMLFDDARSRVLISSFGAPGISMFDASGVPLGAFIQGATGGLANAHGMDIGPDGNLYVASFATDSVLRYDIGTGAFIDALVTPALGGIDAPIDILFVHRPLCPCYPDCDTSTGAGVLDVFDFLCFQDAFVSMNPYADCDGDRALGIFDFLCFQDAFTAGCT